MRAAGRASKGEDAPGGGERGGWGAIKAEAVDPLSALVPASEQAGKPASQQAACEAAQAPRGNPAYRIYLPNYGESHWETPLPPPPHSNFIKVGKKNHLTFYRKGRKN